MSTGIHAGLVSSSRRLLRIIEVLQEAEHPLSSQEIAVRAYDFAASGKIMLNVSTNIGEIRSQENQDAGYMVSFSSIWRLAGEKQEPGLRRNGDGSLTYFVPQLTAPWMDGRPRYWLMAAPGWEPRWWINDHGVMVTGGRGECGMRNAECGVNGNSHHRGTEAQRNARGQGDEASGPRLCPGCREEVPQDGPVFCSAACRQAFFDRGRP